MAWELVEKTQTIEGVSRLHCLAAERTFYLYQKSPDGGLEIGTRIQSLSALAQFEVLSWGVKLSALNDVIIVRPAHARSNILEKAGEEQYHLQGRSATHTEIIFLRDGDTIQASKTNSTFTLQYNPSEVQVNSSVAPDAEIPESEDHLISTDTQKLTIQDSASETEDDEDLDRTIAVEPTDLQASDYARMTPIPSLSRTEVIQETPTVDRLQQIVAFQTNGKATDITSQDHSGTLKEDVTMAAADTFSTAPMKQVEDNVKPPATKDDDNGSEDIEIDVHPGTGEINVEQKSSANTIVPPESSRESNTGHTSDNISPQSLNRSAIGDHIPITKKTGNKRLSPDTETSLTKATGLRASKRAKKLDLEQDIGGQGITPSSTKRRYTKREKKPDEEEGVSIQSTSTLASSRRGPKRTQAGDEELGDSSQNSIAHDRSNRSLGFIPPSQTSPTPPSTAEIFKDDKPKVAFSNSAMPEMPEIMKRFKALGGTEVKNIVKGKCNLLCVRPGALRKSMKLLACISLGIMFVTDKWLQDSVKKGHFLAPQQYMPSVPKQEREWNFSVEKVFGEPQPDVLQGRTVYFTPALKKFYEHFKDVEQVCQAAGAARVISKVSRDIKDTDDEETQTVILALEEDDQDMLTLIEHGHTCYTRDLLTNSILRGAMDLESDEFKIKVGPVQKTPSKRGRPRKS